MNYLISEPLAQAILMYLGDRPYREVYQLIAGLQQMQALPEQEEE